MLSLLHDNYIRGARSWCHMAWDKRVGNAISEPAWKANTRLVFTFAIGRSFFEIEMICKSNSAYYIVDLTSRSSWNNFKNSPTNLLYNFHIDRLQEAWWGNGSDSLSSMPPPRLLPRRETQHNFFKLLRIERSSLLLWAIDDRGNGL